MDIKNDLFRAKAQTKSDKILHFDAIECLVNYLKAKDESTFQKLLVTDCQTKKFIGAKNTNYLKSKAVPSPMGANLSAYAIKSEAESMQKKKGGEVFTWKELRKRFVSSNLGAVDHAHHNHDRADTYAPSGIMGDHLHPKGGFMVSLRYMNMAMNGNREGNDKITDGIIYDRFKVARRT